MKPCNNQKTYRQLINTITSMLTKSIFISEPIRYEMCYDQFLLRLPQQDFEAGKSQSIPSMW